MVWLLMAAAVMGDMLVAPCSKLWYASAIASPGTPFSAHHLQTSMAMDSTGCQSWSLGNLGPGNSSTLNMIAA